jgi:hypothetical protein
MKLVDTSAWSEFPDRRVGGESKSRRGQTIVLSQIRTGFARVIRQVPIGRRLATSFAAICSAGATSRWWSRTEGCGR